MSTARIVYEFLGLSAFCVGLNYGFSKWETASGNRTGVISKTSETGLFVKTKEMTLQRAEVANRNPSDEAEFANSNTPGEIGFSFYKNQELFKKAEEFRKQGTYVDVTYSQYLTRPWFAAESPRKVLDIQPVVTEDSPNVVFKK